ncbi:uncharacterized protein LOC124280357 [Haliotis rubra]|uniref:uncharacterized protein LOC124280357 n=1 Tax=Haliotis rubra TaxID=36100 RepID=UPI001EE631EA|nr:uncharacterized protein LOC124280357 [Haliotis rubra]
MAHNDNATGIIVLTGRPYPEQIEMFPTPDRIQYDYGQLLSIRCTGRIGNQFDENNLQNLWTWEWRSVNSEFSSWTRYPNDQNITYDRPTSVAESGYSMHVSKTTTETKDHDYLRTALCLFLGQAPPGGVTGAPGQNTGDAEPELSSHPESATGASLTASPSQITIGGRNPTSQLTVGCRPNAPGITTVYGMEIGKKSSTGTDHTIIRMTNTDSSVQVVDTGLQQRMTASGSISGATGNIQFILTDLRCADAASTYYCKTVHLVGTDGNDEATINITAGSV